MIIDKFTQVEYAVTSCGGLLGMGESYNPMPWESLTYDVDLGGCPLTLGRARLE